MQICVEMGGSYMMKAEKKGILAHKNGDIQENSEQEK